MAEHMISEGVHMFLNGMGAECCYGTDNMDSVPDGVIQYLISGYNAGGKHIGTKPPKSQGGFSSLDFGDDEVTITFHKEDGAKLYSASVPRRTQAYV